MSGNSADPRDRIADVIGQFMARECTQCGSEFDAADAVLTAFPSLRRTADEELPDDNDGYGPPVHWTVYNDMHKRAITAEAEANRMRSDWAGVMREAAMIAESLREFEPATGARKAAQVSENVGVLRVAKELGRRADEVQAEPRRVLTPGEYHAAWIAVEGAAGDPDADPSTMLAAVLRALDIQANEET